MSAVTGGHVATVGLALGACAASEPNAAAANDSIDPVLFFVGRAHGDAELHKILSRSVHVDVDGVGRTQGNLLILDQITREANHPAQSRRWVIRKVAPNRYSGTLTDAIGPVTITVNGASAEIQYQMSGGLTVRQQLMVQSDGRTMANRLKVTKFGIPVATLRETIRKLD